MRFYVRYVDRVQSTKRASEAILEALFVWYAQKRYSIQVNGRSRKPKSLHTAVPKIPGNVQTDDPARSRGTGLLECEPELLNADSDRTSV